MFNGKDKKIEAELINSNNTIGKGTKITGDTASHGNIRVDGEIKGNVTTKAKIVLGESGLIDGNVVAQTAEISGEIRGIIKVAELLILKPSAQIHGDIITGRMTVEPGAVFNGSCKMGATVKEIKVENEVGRKEKDNQQQQRASATA